MIEVRECRTDLYIDSRGRLVVHKWHRNDKSVIGCAETVKVLLPYLQHFGEHGCLPDEGGVADD